MRSSSLPASAIKDTTSPGRRWFPIALITGLVAVVAVESLPVLRGLTRKRQRANAPVEAVIEPEVATQPTFRDNLAAGVRRGQRYPALSHTEGENRQDRRETLIRSIVESGPEQPWSTTAQGAISGALLSLSGDIQSRLVRGQPRCAMAGCMVDITTSDSMTANAVMDLFFYRNTDALRTWPGWIQYESTKDGEKTTTTFALMKPDDRQTMLAKGRPIHGN